MKVSFIIPNWNGAKKLAKNLPEVLQVARKNKIEEVIVVDDASTDDSLLEVGKFEDVTLIKKSKNSGFSTTANLGVEESRGDIVVLLNSDAVPESDFLAPALTHFNKKEIFSVGCNVGGLWSVGKFADGFFWHNQAKSLEGNKQAHKTLWSSGGSGFFRKEIWLYLDGFDQLYNPFYEEDVDLGYRAIKRGYLNIWEPQSRVVHYQQVGVIKEHFSKSQVAKIAQRNQLIFIWKNITSPQLIGEHRRALLKMIIAHPSYLSVVLSALSKLPQILSKRKVEQKQQKLTDEEILASFCI